MGRKSCKTYSQNSKMYALFHIFQTHPVGFIGVFAGPIQGPYN